MRFTSGHLESWPPGQELANQYICFCQLYRHVCTCLRSYIQAWTCMYMLSTCTYIQICTYMYMYISICMYIVHTFTWFYIFVCILYIHVHKCSYMFGHCTYTSVHVHNHTSFSIKPYQPCDSCCKSQLLAGATPSELPSSWHQSFQSTDHPGAACHAQTATATVSPHMHCCQAFHPLLQCHSCPKNTGKPDLWPLVLAILVRTGRSRVTSQD